MMIISKNTVFQKKKRAQYAPVTIIYADGSREVVSDFRKDGSIKKKRRKTA